MAERVPGIIVRITNDVGVIPPPAYQRYPTIIGCGDPYNVITNLQMTRGTGAEDLLPCVTTINEIVSVGDLPGIAKYVEAVDYELVGGTNQIRWLGGDQPTAGDSYYITYTETRAASAYSAMLYFDETLIYQDHGATIRTNGQINDVSKGASLAFANGAKGVVVLQLDDRSFADPDSPTPAELEQAFNNAVNELERILRWRLVLVGMSTGELATVTAASILFNHAVLASQPENKQERCVIMAMPEDTSVLQYAQEANAYDHERISVVAIPSALQLPGVAAVATQDFDARFACAAAAGKLCSGPVGRNISDEILTGITFSDNFTPNEARFLVQNAVSPLKSDSGIVRVVMLITTNPTSALTEDWGIIETGDYVKKYWREGLWDVYRNKPITLTLPSDIVGTSNNMLKVLIGDEIIADFRRVTAVQDESEPRKIKVRGQILPAFGLQWMDIDFVFSMNFNS